MATRLITTWAICVILAHGSWAYAQTCSQRFANSSEGVGVDTAGNVWVSGKLNGTLYRYSYSPNGQTVNVDEFDLPGFGAYGVAVTPVDDNVWVAVGGFKVSSENRVLRFDNDGNLLEDIPIIYDNHAGLETNAVAVDADGHVWVTSSEGGSVSVARITPAANPLQHNCDTLYDPADCSPVDMAVDLDTWDGISLMHANPFNYGDMTGMVTTRTRAKGTWTAVHDGGVYDTAWSKVTLNAFDTGPCTEVGGTEDTEGSDERFEIAVRAADAEVDLASAVYQEGIQSGVEFSNVWGRFIEVRVRLSATAESEINPPDHPFTSPALCDVTVEGRGWTDCNHNNASDQAEISANPELDCNVNGILDVCEIDVNSAAPGGPFFCHAFCDPDCNGNGIPDACDVDASDPDGDGWVSNDCDGNRVPDEAPCEPDCNHNGTPDVCDILAGEPDYDLDGIPDVCNSPVGACCGQQDYCASDMTKAHCETQGIFSGFFLGAGSDCTDDPCHTGACCHSDGTCDVTTNDITCESQSGSTFLGYGSTCETYCCPGSAGGGDRCDIATATVIDVTPYSCWDSFPSEFESPYVPCDPDLDGADCPVPVLFPPAQCLPTYKLTRHAAATGHVAPPLIIETCPSLDGELVWWESFGINIAATATVTVDFCCTDPPMTAYHTVIYDGCVNGCPSGAGIRADDVVIADCPDGNPKLQWTLPAGTYYYPIPVEGRTGANAYQLNFEVVPGELAACCTGQNCTKTDELDCEAGGGIWLGHADDPLDDPIVTCDPNPCAGLGACCLEYGTCDESAQLNTEAECEANPDNEFQGGVNCADAGCSLIMCDIEDDSRCKSPGGDLFVLSDAGAYVRTADDLVTEAGASLSQLCWRGNYYDFSQAPVGATQVSATKMPFTDCSAAYGNDNFTVTVYEDDNGQPGSVVTSQSLTQITRTPIINSYGATTTFEYSATLGVPATLTVDTRYWLEIQNQSQNGVDDSCYWAWESSAESFNSVSARDTDCQWNVGDVGLTSDLSMCLGNSDIQLHPTDGTTPVGACCDPTSGQCIDNVPSYACDGPFHAGVACNPQSTCPYACCDGSGVCSPQTIATCTGDFIPGVTCDDDQPCACRGTRCCYEEDAGPGCGDPPCCTTICAVDPYCCEIEWDEACVNEAINYCDPATSADECLHAPLAAGPPHDVLKNRYLSIDPNNSGTVAIRVTMTASEFHPEALGTARWVGAPDGQGIAGLVAAPVARVWPETVIHVTGCKISPMATYEVRATDDLGLTFTPALSVETSVQPIDNKWFGDVVGSFDPVADEWSPPDRLVTINDTVAAIKTFQDPSRVGPGCGSPPCNATHVSVTDVEPQVPNRLVNINDVFLIVLGFQGNPYPFGCPDDPCFPRTAENPCPEGFMGGGMMAGGESATISMLSLAASSDLIQQNDLIDVEVFLDVADDLGGYQLDLQATGGGSGSLDLENMFIDDTRVDYVFFGMNSMESVSSYWGQVGAADLDGAGIPVIGPAYLGTFQFRASADAEGVFTIRFEDTDNNFLMNGQATQMTDAIADDEVFIGVGVDCAIDAHCDDDNACTDDTCDNGTCVNTNNDSNTCTDGNDCTADACVAGVCTSTNEPVNTPCDDGLFCTKTDKCDGAGVCVGTGDPCKGQTPYCCEYTGTCTALPCI